MGAKCPALAIMDTNCSLQTERLYLSICLLPVPPISTAQAKRGLKVLTWSTRRLACMCGTWEGE